MKTTCCALLLLLASPLLHAAPAVSHLALALTCSPDVTLPGIPVTVRVVVTNNSAQRVELPAHLILQATTETGERFLPGGSDRPHFDVVLLGDPFVLPHSSTVLEIEVEGAAIQAYSWFDDPRLNKPGRLQLQAILGTFSPELTEIPEGAIRSNVAALDIQTPTGVDLAVWKEMLAIGNGSWVPGLIATTARELTRRVVTETPQSSYAGWFATSAPWEPTRESAALLRSWLAQAPQDALTEWRQYRLALLEEHAARQWSRSTPDEVRAHIRAARTLLAQSKKSKNPKIARLAAEREELDADLDELVH